MRPGNQLSCGRDGADFHFGNDRNSLKAFSSSNYRSQSPELKQSGISPQTAATIDRQVTFIHAFSAVKRGESTSDEFLSPIIWLKRFFEFGTKKSARFTTVETEERQAALFSYAYAAGRGIDSLLVRPGEGPQKDYDAEFRWRDAAVDRRLPVSLKRLPPTAVNPKETLDGIIKKTAIKSTGGDLLLAIQIDRSGHLTSLTIPRKFQIKELCLWGWSKPNHAELFVNSYVIGDAVSHQWRTPFPPPGFRSKDQE